MVRSSADAGPRRSRRQRRLKFDTLNQSFLWSPQFAEYIVTEANHRIQGNSDEPNARGIVQQRKLRVPRELVALHDPVEPSEDEEILDIYSRVKRRTRHRPGSGPLGDYHHGFGGPGCSSSNDTSNQSAPVLDGSISGPPPPKVMGKSSSAGNGGTNEEASRSEDESEDEDEDDDSDEEEEEEEETAQLGGRKYHLRESRPTTQRFEIKIPEKRRRHQPLEIFSPAAHHSHRPPRHSAPEEAAAYRSPAHKTFCHRRRLTLPALPRRRSPSLSSNSDADERKFAEKTKGKLEMSRQRFLPLNIPANEARSKVFRERFLLAEASGKGSSCTDIDPMHIDKSITFESIGGLKSHIRSLKEMVVFPLLYPEVFEKFQISPPRGVVFYGPPGTGKTLMARALANECGQGKQKVSFFMRKGADCLSKWVGESERQLRTLFDQAYRMRPSIIFFDEIDGLAPVRSARQDQIHSSIVSTLLALMDGLDSRQDVIIIGATNRLDSIDPALRRPGRFDRELRFSLPDASSRAEIFRINTKAWDPPIPKDLVDVLASKAIGYCGADIKGLCTQATLIALQRRYPQIYGSNKKLALDMNELKVTELDFKVAMETITPAVQRGLAPPVRAIPDRLLPLMCRSLAEVLSMIPNTYKPASTAINASDSCSPSLSNSLPNFAHLNNLAGCSRGGFRLVLSGASSEHGQTAHLAPAVLGALDPVPVFPLALHDIYCAGHRTPEEAVAETIRSALKTVPAILYIPQLEAWRCSTNDTAWQTLVSLLDQMDPAASLLLLATVHCPAHKLAHEIKSMFNLSQVYEAQLPTADERREFFSKLFASLKVPPRVFQNVHALEELQLAPEEPLRKLTPEEERAIAKAEDAVHRELRIFLREILGRLLRDRKHSIFVKPVDSEEVPDYHEIIREPMELSRMMTKIDQHKYGTVNQFLADIDLIVRNALQYNPDREVADKIIRHRAFGLRDAAYALVDAELDWDFEKKCQEIADSRLKRGTTTTAPGDAFCKSQAQPQRVVDNLTADIIRLPGGGSSDSVAAGLHHHYSTRSQGPAACSDEGFVGTPTSSVPNQLAFTSGGFQTSISGNSGLPAVGPGFDDSVAIETDYRAVVGEDNKAAGFGNGMESRAVTARRSFGSKEVLLMGEAAQQHGEPLSDLQLEAVKTEEELELDDHGPSLVTAVQSGSAKRKSTQKKNLNDIWCRPKRRRGAGYRRHPALNHPSAAAIVRKYSQRRMMHQMSTTSSSRNSSLEGSEGAAAVDSMTTVSTARNDLTPVMTRIENHRSDSHAALTRHELQEPDPRALETLLSDLVGRTEDWTVFALDRMYVRMEEVVAVAGTGWDRRGVLEKLREVMESA